MNNTGEFPLPYTPQRHALLHQIHTHAGTNLGWTRTPNPRKAMKPQSGLPDHLYDQLDSGHRPSANLQRATRELDHHGLLGPERRMDGPDNLDTSPLGTRVLDTWTEKHGTPADPR